jgi:hypothetical protein
MSCFATVCIDYVSAGFYTEADHLPTFQDVWDTSVGEAHDRLPR